MYFICLLPGRWRNGSVVCWRSGTNCQSVEVERQRGELMELIMECVCGGGGGGGGELPQKPLRKIKFAWFPLVSLADALLACHPISSSAKN